MSGWTDLPLNGVGRIQAERLGRRFRDEPPVAALYSSPLSRARDTAAQIVHASAAPVEIVADLKEINCGEVDGAPIAVVVKLHAPLWKRNLRQEDDNFRWPGGESYRELRERSLRALRDIAAAHKGERVAVVTHCGVVTQIVGALHGYRPARWDVFRPQNTSLTILRWSEPQPELVAFNDHRHLDALTAHASANIRPRDE
jgi:broad specificity phosphatase PhoE